MLNYKKLEIVMFTTWVIIFPMLLYYTYEYTYMPDTLDIANLIGFLILMSIVAFLPIIVNDTPIFFVQGVSVAVFLIFGLLIEMVFMQIAIIILFGKVRLQRNDLYRLPMNLIMFLIISVLGGLVYYALGGTHEHVDTGSASFLIPATAYILATYITNQVIIMLIRRFIHKRKMTKLISNDIIWDFISSFMIYPVGIVLYMLYLEHGKAAILFVGIPFISISLILQLFYTSKRMNIYLQEVSEFGHHLAEIYQANEVVDLFLDKLTKMLQVDYAFVLEVADDEELRLMKQIVPASQEVLVFKPLKRKEGISGHVWNNSKAVLYRSRKEWLNDTNSLPQSVESILCVPVSRNQQVIGVVLLASNQKRAYEKSHLMLVDIMTSYFAVSIENAKHYEETKNDSERCPLTKLYNYRYFEGLLDREFKKLNEEKIYQHLSLMLLDLDYFKTINDNYGHQSGNEVLIEVAKRIVDVIGLKGTVARYGGEEFVVLLPNLNNNECILLAEEVRKAISSQPFTIHHNLENIRRRIMVRVTVSIGIASAPFDAEDAFSLVRHADRAMYNGAKLVGRNKVAQYVK